MAYLKESDVRRASRTDRRVMAKSMDSALEIREASLTAALTDKFDVFLCHSIRDADLVQGAKKILEDQGLTVYVDWIVDPKMDRSAVTAKTAAVLRIRMQKSRSLLYLFSNGSKRSRWMPWELGYFDGQNGAVGVLPIVPDDSSLDFGQEEYLGLYPKVELENSHLFVNRTKNMPVSGDDQGNYLTFKEWVANPEKLKL